VGETYLGEFFSTTPSRHAMISAVKNSRTS
jgi:hypothetical protein